MSLKIKKSNSFSKQLSKSKSTTNLSTPTKSDKLGGKSDKLGKSDKISKLEKPEKKIQRSVSDKSISQPTVSLQTINDKINSFKKKEEYSSDVKALVERGYQILKNMDDIDEIKQGYHIKLKLKSTTKKNNNKIIQGGFLLKVVKEIIDGKLEFYMQVKSYNRIYRYNLDTVAYIFYKEVTPNALKIEKLEKKIEYMEKKHKLDYLKLVKLVKLGKI